MGRSFKLPHAATLVGELTKRAGAVYRGEGLRGIWARLKARLLRLAARTTHSRYFAGDGWMTGRERVRASLTFSKPDRVPRHLWVLQDVLILRPNDFAEVNFRYPSDIQFTAMKAGEGSELLEQLTRPGTYTDDWGSVWQNCEVGSIGEVVAPVLRDWGALASFRPPEHLITAVDWDYVNRSCDRSKRFLLSACSARPFERLQFLRGTEALLIDLAYDTREIRELLQMVHGFYLQNVTAWAKSNVDAIFMMDDWGMQQSLFINPKMWRKSFKPLYKEYCDIAHAGGKFVFFHSDGNITSIYDDLIEIGVDALNSQLFCMDIEELGRRFKGKVTFWGEIDQQHVLPFGAPNDVAAAVQRVRCALEHSRGGVIAECTWRKDYPKESIEAVFRSWL